MDEMTRFQRLALDASRVFTPSQPIASAALFAGRLGQVTRIVDAVNEPGRHAILFGERGTGKTSLANNLSVFLSREILAPRVGCISGDTYNDLWRKAFKEITFNVIQQRTGFRVGADTENVDLAAKYVGTKITPDDVRRELTAIGEQIAVVIIFDEFDTLTSGPTRKAMAETIKLFSDHSVPATLVLVGVADSVTDLLVNHQSVERAIVQVPMPRMLDEELSQILSNGMNSLGMSMTEDARVRIVTLSKGLPHYTHLLGLFATRAALNTESFTVNGADVERAIDRALTETQQSTIDAYEKATSSQQRKHLYRQVLLACALAKTDPLGYFSAADVRQPLSDIMKKPYDIPSYTRHLNEFCEMKRGPVLKKAGSERRYRFRFENPLMQPFVILQGQKLR